MFRTIQTRPQMLSDSQKILCSLWTDLLKRPPDNLDASFFETGGHSLLAIQYLYSIQNRFGINLKYAEFERLKTIRNLSERIDAESQPIGNDKSGHFKISRAAVSPLSSLCYKWKDFYAHEIANPVVPGKLICRAFVLDGRLNRARLQKAINWVVNLHERLRTQATKVGSVFYEEIVSQVQVTWKFEDLTDQGESKAMAKAQALFRKASLRGMDLQKSPLVETQLLKLNNRRFFFIFSLHHSVGDGQSLAILLKQISKTYAELSQNQAPTTRPSRFSFRQYYNSYEAWLEGENRKRLEKFWKRETKRIYPYKFPFEKKRISRSKRYHTHLESFRFTEPWNSRIRDLSENLKISPFIFLLTTVTVLIYRYLGNPQVFVCSATDTRKTPEERRIVGDFGSHIYLTHQLRPTGNFQQLLKSIASKFYEVVENNILGSPRLGKWVPDSNENGTNPAHQINVMSSGETGTELSFPGIQTTSVPRPPRPATTKLNLVLHTGTDPMTLDLHYPPALFLKHGIARMLFNLQWFMRIALDSPDVIIGQFPNLRTHKYIRGPLNRREQSLAIFDRSERQLFKD